MEVLYLLIPLSVALVALAAVMFVRAVATKQFDELDRHGLDILKSDEENVSERSNT